MSDSFLITYQVDDGYAGGARPQYFNIELDDIEKDMDDNDLEKFFYEKINENFQENISTSSSDKDRFIKWAKDKIKIME